MRTIILIPVKATYFRHTGTDSTDKMSNNLGNCIFLSNLTYYVQNKNRIIYTDSSQLSVQDPGQKEDITISIYQYLFCKLENFNRYSSEYQKFDVHIYYILKQGCVKSHEVTANTLYEVRSGMKAKYFDDA